MEDSLLSQPFGPTAGTDTRQKEDKIAEIITQQQNTGPVWRRSAQIDLED